jgi:hypothetical protein
LTIIGVNFVWQLSHSDSTAPDGAAPAKNRAAAMAQNNKALLISLLLSGMVTKMSRFDYPPPI